MSNVIYLTDYLKKKLDANEDLCPACGSPDYGQVWSGEADIYFMECWECEYSEDP